MDMRCNLIFGVRRIFWIFLFCALVPVSKLGVAAAPGTPLQAIIDLEKQLDSYKVGKNLSEADLEANRKLKQDVIKGTFDVAELSRVSMSKHWTELTPEQQSEFVDIMTQLLQKKAIFSKEQSQTQDKPYRIRYDKEVFLNDEKDMARVYTVITIPKDNVSLNLSYKLKRIEGQWKIFDVIVDDSSLVTNYQFQFHSIITKSGYPELLRRMKAKLGELGSKSEGTDQSTQEAGPAQTTPPSSSTSSVATPPVSMQVEAQVQGAQSAQVSQAKHWWNGCSLVVL